MKYLLWGLLFCAAPLHAATVDLSWTASTSAQTETITYNVYRLDGYCPLETNDLTQFTQLATGITGTTYSDATVGATSCYTVTAVFAYGDQGQYFVESTPSNTVTASIPAATSGLTQTGLQLQGISEQ